MSTTFDIIPVDTKDISFGQVILKSEQCINDYLQSIGIYKKVQLNVNIHDYTEEYVKRVDFKDKFEWKENEYVWFAIDGVAGGTDGHCKQLQDNIIDPENPWRYLEEIELNNRTINSIKKKLERAKILNTHWYFRRSSGQHGITVLSYGLISAAIAELTNGILWSEDGAWSIKQFPSEYRSFIDWYFRPEKAVDHSDGEWAKVCIEDINRSFS